MCPENTNNILDSFWSANKLGRLFDLKYLEKKCLKIFAKKVLKSTKAFRKYHVRWCVLV